MEVRGKDKDLRSRKAVATDLTDIGPFLDVSVVKQGFERLGAAYLCVNSYVTSEVVNARIALVAMATLVQVGGRRISGSRAIFTVPSALAQ